LLGLLALLLPVAAPGTAQEPSGLPIEPGQAIELRLGSSGDGDIRITAIAQAEWAPYDLAAARHLAGQPIPDAPQPHAEPLPRGPIAPEPVEAGVVNLRFFSIAGRAAFLAIENGYDGALTYRAQMTREGQSRHTDVCLVVPLRRGYEYWPHPIDRLILSDFRLVPWREGQRVTCE
jgi:hypothetical protein